MKVPGHDQLNTEFFKADLKLAARYLLPLFVKIWVDKKVHDDWCKATIVNIPKKGDLTNCNNWRGITLLSVPSKVFCKTIIKRILTAVNKLLRKEQAGYRKRRRCTDHVFTVLNITGQCSECQREMCINFVDFEKASDSIHRDNLWKTLCACGIATHTVDLIKLLY